MEDLRRDKKYILGNLIGTSLNRGDGIDTEEPILKLKEICWQEREGKREQT